MEKENLSISQVAALLNTKAYVLRFYENEFALEIPRTPSNRRYYTNREINQLRYIYKLKNEGIKNKDIKTVLKTSRMNIDFFSTSPPQPSSYSQPVSLGDLLDKKEESLKQVALAIAQLKKDMDEIKAMYHTPHDAAEQCDMQRLLEENEGLRKRLKEKTYELVDLKEKIKNTKKARRFFS